MTFRESERPDRKNRFYIHWRADGKRFARAFPTAQDRQKARAKLEKAAGKHGEAPLSLTAAEAREYRDAVELCRAGGLGLMDAVKSALASAKGSSAGDQAPVAISPRDAVEAYLGQLRFQGLADAYIYHVGIILGRFAASASTLRVGADAIREWIGSFGHGPETVNHYRVAIRRFYDFAKTRGWILDNPAAEIPMVKFTRPEPGILTVAQASDLFRENRGADAEICALLALCAFGGIRSEMVCRVTEDMIDRSRRMIDLPAAIMKSRRRHLMESHSDAHGRELGLPGNIWAWLATVKVGEMSYRDFQRRRGLAFARARIEKPPKNCLRHSFCTYVCAADGNAARAAALLPHRDLSTLYEHYRGYATSEDGRAYLSIAP